MKKTQNILQILRQLRVPASGKLDERVHREIDLAATPDANAPITTEPTLGQLFALIMKKSSTRYTVASTLALAGLITFALTHPSSSAWAMEQSIETLKKYKGLELSGNNTSDGKTQPIDLWLRADASGDWVEAVLAKVGDAATLWTRDNQTYTYVSDDKTVYLEPGITQALNPWPGPKLLSLLAKAKDYQAIEGDDPASGRKRVVATCTLDGGTESFLLEFDVRSKLLVSLKIWHNSRQEGTPSIDFEKILYFADLPASTFNFSPPAGTAVTNMPLTILDAEASVPELNDPNYGISAAGMTREAACQEILKQYWAANLQHDFPRLRQLMPLNAGATDEFFRESWDQTGIVQVVKIGGIERTGASKLGPLALVPTWVRCADGTVSEIWMIVQFRDTDKSATCVVCGEHGYAINVQP